MKILSNANGVRIPYVGLGTFPIQGRELADVVKIAIYEGYRLFDTADDYRGEPGIGLAVKEIEKESTLTRRDLFLQTKISDNNAYADEVLKGVYFNPSHSFMKRHTVEEIVREKVETSLYNLGTSYLDSLLIHYPFPHYYVEVWKVLIRLREEKIVRYIGVSNFHKKHIEKLIKETDVIPDINQIYLSPIGTKEELLSYCHSISCIPMTYSPLMDIKYQRINETDFHELMAKYNKTLAQIILKWNIERGCIPLPKSKKKERLKENFALDDFNLTQEEVDYISSMNKNFQLLVESKICPGI